MHTIYNPKHEYKQKRYEDYTEPVEVYVLCVREALFQLGVVFRNGEYRPHGIAYAVNGSLQHLGIVEHNVAGDGEEYEGHHKQQFMKHDGTPRNACRAAQFD